MPAPLKSLRAYRRWGKRGEGGDIVVLVNTSSPFSVHFTFSSKVISPY